MATKDSNYERLSQPWWPPTYFFVVFWIYSHEGKRLQVNWYPGNHFCEGKRSKIKALTSRTTPTMPLPTSWQPSRVVLGPHFTSMCQVLEAFVAPATSMWRGDTRTGNHTWQQQPEGTKGGGTRCMRRKLPPVYLLNMHTLSFSLHSCNLLPSAYKRESWGSLRKGALAFDFLLSLLSRGALPFFFYLQPAMILTLQRLGKSSLSHPFVPPTTNQRK
jgi:hypothetical protein